jgi:type II secretion system protein H
MLRTAHAYRNPSRAIARRAGMTFLELMVVISIISIFTVMAIPAMRGPHEKNKLRGAAREIVATMRYARSAAVMFDGRVKMEVDLAQQSYRLVLPEMAKKKSKWAAGVGEEPMREVELWRDLPRDSRGMIEIEKIYSWDDPDPDGDIVRIFFFPDGSASDSSITLVNKFDQRMTVYLSRATAEARVETGAPTDEG